MDIRIPHVPENFYGYVRLSQHTLLIDALKDSQAALFGWMDSFADHLADYAYAPGKWTVKEVLCHLIDAERIFAYRALRFSRNDQTQLSPFDENAYVPNSNAGSRSVQSIKEEMIHLRLSTISLFQNCTDDMLDRTGLANKGLVSVKALGYIIAGHECHHLNIFKERYSR